MPAARADNADFTATVDPHADPRSTTCPICAGDSARILFRTHDRWMHGPGEFAFARCNACSTSYLLDRPGDAAMAAYYPPGYIRTGRAPAALRKAFRRLDLAARVRLAAAQPGRRVLDIGCARGDFLQEMRTRGWIVAGVEPTEWLAHEALGLGIPVWTGTLEDVSLPAHGFDVVTLWDVLEHVADPVADLQRVRRLLAPGGRVLVNTPLADGWDARLFGTSWSGWDAPRHAVVFTRATLSGALERAGFELVGWHRVFETYLITALTIGLDARERLPRPIAEALWGLLHARPVRLVLAPVFAVLDRAFGASSLTAVGTPAQVGHAERAAP